MPEPVPVLLWVKTADGWAPLQSSTDLPITEGELITATRERAIPVSTVASIAPGQYLDCNNGDSQCVKVINLFWEYDVDIEWDNGKGSIVIATEYGNGCWLNLAIYCYDVYHLKIKNRHPTISKYIGFNGILVPSALS